MRSIDEIENGHSSKLTTLLSTESHLLCYNEELAVFPPFCS